MTRPRPLLLALAAAHALGCASTPPKPALPRHKTFHYKASATDWVPNKLWHTTIDVNSETRWADAIHLTLDKPSTLRVKTQLARQVPVNVLIYAGGKKPLLVERAPTAIELPKLQGDLWVVVRVGETTGQIVVKAMVDLIPEPGAVPPPPPAADPGAPPLLSAIPDLEFDEHAPE